MAIRRSSSTEVEELIASLLSGTASDADREGALARLAVIGPRAVSHILRALLPRGTSEERVRLLHALERVPSPRAVKPVLEALGTTDGGTAGPVEVRVAAARAARPLLDLPAGTASLLDRLTTIALDPAEPAPVRHASLDALEGLSARTLRPIRKRLAADPDPAMRARARGAEGPPPIEPGDRATLSQPEVPGDPDAVLSLLGRTGAGAPLSSLHALIGTVRDRESAGGRRKAEWAAVRGAIHVTLARRGSRVALYDLRETFERVEGHPLPPDFAAAVAMLGDASCLEPLAHAWMHAPRLAGAQRASWEKQLREAFHQVWHREKPASRRRVLDRLQHRWADAAAAARLQELAGPGPRAARRQ